MFVPAGAGKLERAALRFHAGINPVLAQRFFSPLVLLPVCLSLSVCTKPPEPFLLSGFISLKRWL